jgi:aldehyde dehydrogenase (NAD+)
VREIQENLWVSLIWTSEPSENATLLTRQREYFRGGGTRSLSSRHEALDRLREGIRAREDAILAALAADLGKSPEEAYATEVAFLYQEIRFAKRNLRRWARPRRVGWDLFQFPGRGRIHREPYGCCLLLGPWNYPLQLLLAPLVGALAGGNTAILKPSELAPASEAVLAELVADFFAQEQVAVVRGGPETSQALLQLPFDKIFFTGSTSVGRKVLAAAAAHLIPCTLELGGKSPAIVGESADLSLAARRIVWGKFLNAGQTCVAPDFALVHRRHHEAFLQKLDEEIKTRFGDDPRHHPQYGRIVHRAHYDRLVSLLKEETPARGGEREAADLYFAPTIVAETKPESPLLREEIFGPILPVLPFEESEEVIARLRDEPAPLALYLFSSDSREITLLRESLPSGGICVNGTLLQLLSPRLPFGGVGSSGMGEYHGKASFEAFTRRRSELRMPARLPWHLTDPRRPLPLAFLRRWFR